MPTTTRKTKKKVTKRKPRVRTFDVEFTAKGVAQVYAFSKEDAILRVNRFYASGELNDVADFHDLNITTVTR